jgi:hypothetical protein
MAHTSALLTQDHLPLGGLLLEAAAGAGYTLPVPLPPPPAPPSGEEGDAAFTAAATLQSLCGEAYAAEQAGGIIGPAWLPPRTLRLLVRGDDGADPASPSSSSRRTVMCAG